MTSLVARGAEHGALAAATWTLRSTLVWVVGPALAGVAGTNLLTAAVYGSLIQLRTATRRARRELSPRGYRVETARNIGWAVGAFLGMSLGALVGSAVPVLGTLVVSLALGGVGGLLGALAGRVVGWTVYGRRDTVAER